MKNAYWWASKRGCKAVIEYTCGHVEASDFKHHLAEMMAYIRGQAKTVCPGCRGDCEEESVRYVPSTYLLVDDGEFL